MPEQSLQLYDGETANEKEREKEKQLRIKETSARTREALNKLVSKKLHDDKVTTLSESSTNDNSTYIRYTSAQIANLSNNVDKNIPKQRIIKITDEKVDPMLPPSFRIRKTPAGPQTDDIVPVMHDEATTEKLTKADQKKWQIAPSVSNWKNTKGFVIGIENRLQNTVSSKEVTAEEFEKSTKRFTALSDALKNAEKQAKQDLKARASWRKRKEAEELAETQERLTKLAEEARLRKRAIDLESVGIKKHDKLPTTQQGHPDKLSSKLERRAERRRKAEEELKRDGLSTKDKIRKLASEQGRDVSERVVLGVSEALKQKQKQSVYDSDLFLKSNTLGTASEGDKVYDTPLFSQEAALDDVYRTRNLSGFKGLGSKGEHENHSTSVNFVKDADAKN